MSSSAKAEAVLALHRFGMGPRTGSIAAIEADPRGALFAELERPPADLVAASALPSSIRAFRTVSDRSARRQAQLKRQRMSGASMAPPMGDAVPDPGRQFYL